MVPDLSLPRQHLRNDEAKASRPLKQPRIERRWHGNLDANARSLVILLQIRCVEPSTRDVTFEATYEGSNRDQFARPVEGMPGHQHNLKGPVNPLTKAERSSYVAATIKRILDFLQMQ